jgi:hypothetical protein
VQQNDHGTISAAGFGVADVEKTGIDLLQRADEMFDGFAVLDCAFAEPLMTNWAAANPMAAVAKKSRRSRSLGSDISVSRYSRSAFVV